MLSWNDITRNQVLAFFLGIFAAVVYWFQLLLLTQTKLSIESNQLVGLAFAVSIAVLSWLRFVMTTAGSFKNPASN